jgi:PAS domain S-box-containing protein
MAHDLTNVLQAQTALRESEERLRVAAEVGRMYAWEWNPGTDTVRRSAESACILGVRDSSAEGVAKDYFSLVHPSDRAELISLAKGLTPGQPEYHTTYRRLRGDGTLLWLEESGHGTFDAAGKMVRLVGMTADITERKQAEEKLKASEEFSRQVVQKSPVAMLVSRGFEQEAILINDKFTALFGYSHADMFNVEDWWPLAYPDELYRAAVRDEWQLRVGEAMRKQAEIEPMEAKVCCKDGSYRYIEFYFAPLGDASLVTFIDLTECKNAEWALARLGRRLIEAQEEERTRIAREFHDDLCLELAVLGHGLERLRDVPFDSDAETREFISRLRKRVSEVLMAVATLSHELHSPKVELLGLDGAVRSLCEEVARSHQVKINFVARDLPDPLPNDVSICLYRVAQEALRNSVKHSGADTIEVELSGVPGAVHLSVRDAGIGFDPETGMNSPGIGLISMRERINLVQGTMTILSEPQGGAEIHCSVPVATPAVGAATML